MLNNPGHSWKRCESKLLTMPVVAPTVELDRCTVEIIIGWTYCDKGATREIVKVISRAMCRNYWIPSSYATYAVTAKVITVIRETRVSTDNMIGRIVVESGFAPGE
jgi:hypothetical protein